MWLTCWVIFISELDYEFLFGPQLYFTFYFQHTIYLSWNTPRTPQFWIRIVFFLNSLMNAVSSLILRHMTLSGFTDHLCFSNSTTIHKFPSLLVWKKAFPFLESFLKSLSFLILNLNPAILLLSLFSAHYLQLFSLRIRGRVSDDISFISHFFPHIWIFLHWF